MSPHYKRQTNLMFHNVMQNISFFYCIINYTRFKINSVKIKVLVIVDIIELHFSCYSFLLRLKVWWLISKGSHSSTNDEKNHYYTVYYSSTFMMSFSGGMVQ